MIRSEVHRGLIYAGETPLACTIAVEQTGPMVLTIRAGSFTTTGEAVIRSYEPARHDALLDAKRAERTREGRVRVWRQDEDGEPIEKSATFTLSMDRILPITADPVVMTSWRAGLALDPAGAVTILPESRRAAEPWPPTPAGWRVLHALVFDFDVPPGTASLAALPIYALRVLPGFPDGTGPEDWQTQSARRGMR